MAIAARRPDFKRTLDPGMIKRGMFPGKMDSTFWFDNLFMKQGLLTRVKEGKRATCIGIIVPHMGGACFKFLFDLRMNKGNIFDGLLDTLMRQERAPALSIFRPGIACQQDTASGFLAIICVIQIADGKVSDSATTIDAIILFQKQRVLKKYLGEAS